jgi:cyclomaltodextrinase / maltogenic alpha-amylase / neopullulanase
MAGIQVTPSQLIKKLVGESLIISVSFPNHEDYEVQVWADFNAESRWYEAVSLEQAYQVKVPLIKSGFYQWSMRFRKAGTKRWRQYSDHHGNKIQSTVQVDPAWVGQAIIYNVFVRFFKGKHEIEPNTSFPRANGMGTFDDVKAHLDELKELKVNVLYLNPIHPIGELYRGFSPNDPLPPYLQPGSPYSVKDYKAIDPELTFDKDTEQFALSDPQQEFKDLIDAAHDRGMFVFMDLVFNHTAHDFVLQRLHPEWYLYKEEPMNLAAPYLYPDDAKEGKPWGNQAFSVPPYDHDTWWADCAQVNWEYMIPPAANDPPPNYTLKDMWAYFASIPRYWIKHYRIDGFRADVAYRVPPAFWKMCIKEARDAARMYHNNMSHDVVFIAESYTNDLKTLQECGFTAVYGDFTHKLGSAHELKGYLDYAYNLSGDHFPTGSRWFHFPESHDFGRTPTKVLGDGAESQPEIAHLVNQSRWLLTATLPGIPLIFNGFEHIEWRPINIMSYGAVTWRQQAALKDFIVRINSLRHHSPILQKGSYEPLTTNQGMDANTQLFSFLRSFNGEMIIVAVNMDVFQQAGPAIISLPEMFSGSYTLTDALTGEVFERQGRELIVLLPPGQGHVFTVTLQSV